MSLYAGSCQPKHIHYDEQVIYVVQGQAISVLDGEEDVYKRQPEACLPIKHWKAIRERDSRQALILRIKWKNWPARERESCLEQTM